MVATEVPDDAGVRDTLERWKRERELHERMRLEVGDHFTVSFEGPEDAAMAAQALESLNRAFWRICDVLGAFPVRSIPVVLYTGEQFRDITRSPQWAAAAFDGIIRVPMRGAGEKGEDLDRVLAHEFSHALIRSLATSRSADLAERRPGLGARERRSRLGQRPASPRARQTPSLTDARRRPSAG